MTSSPSANTEQEEPEHGFENRRLVIPAKCPGNKPGDPHFQKTKSPIQKAEDQGTNGNGPDMMNLRQMPDHGGIHPHPPKVLKYWK